MWLTSFFRGAHPEPPAWLYNLLARGALAGRIYRRIVADLAASLPAGALLLDVGTGPGYLLRYLLKERPDEDFYPLAFAPAIFLSDWRLGNAFALPYAHPYARPSKDQVNVSCSNHLPLFQIKGHQAEPWALPKGLEQRRQEDYGCTILHLDVQMLKFSQIDETGLTKN